MCAIKIQEIEAKMSDAQRQDLVRWALRECEIQKSLRHPRTVVARSCACVSVASLLAQPAHGLGTCVSMSNRPVSIYSLKDSASCLKETKKL